MGFRRAMEFLLFGRKLDSKELVQFGLANQIFPTASFHDDVDAYLRKQLDINDPQSILVTKKLMTGPLKSQRINAVTESMNAIAERLREGAPQRMFERRQKEMFGAAAGKAKI